MPRPVGRNVTHTAVTQRSGCDGLIDRSVSNISASVSRVSNCRVSDNSVNDSHVSVTYASVSYVSDSGMCDCHASDRCER